MVPLRLGELRTQASGDELMLMAVEGQQLRTTGPDDPVGFAQKLDTKRRLSHCVCDLSERHQRCRHTLALVY